MDNANKSVLAVQGGTRDEIALAIGDMANEEVLALMVIERQAEKPRSTVIDAIKAEMDRRAEAENAALAEAGEAGKVELSADVEELRAQLAEMTAQRDDLAAKLAKAEKVTLPPKKREAKRVKFKVSDKALFGEATIVMLGGKDGLALTALPALEFADSDFGFIGSGKVLGQAIDVPADVPPVQIACVGLFDAEGRCASVIELLAPVSAGGGQRAMFDTRTLLFSAPEA